MKITQKETINRWQNYRNILKDKNLDALILTSAAAVFYTTNYEHQFPEDKEGIVIISNDEVILVVPVMFANKTKDVFDGVKVITFATGFWTAVSNLLKTKSVGFDAYSLLFAEYEFLKSNIKDFVPLGQELRTIRHIKSSYEIEKLRVVESLTCNALENALSKIKIGMTEKDAGLTLEEYWDQIIKGCYLNEQDPISKWKEVFKQIEIYLKKLNALKIDKVHVEGPEVDLWITIGENRQWLGGSGRNIPSFEIFTSPDWRGTNGWIKFNQPLYRFGSLIDGIELEFKNGKVINAKARKNENVIKEMIKAENADKIGEFSLTDSRFSKITKFMAETLFDENMGGSEGNTHLALGKAYNETFDGKQSDLTAKLKKKLGLNDSPIHTDIISTAKRKVTAYLANGTEMIIYKDGKFTL